VYCCFLHQLDVMKHLGVPAPTGLLALPVRRDNLQVSVHPVSDEVERRRCILELVKHPVIHDPDNQLGLEQSPAAEGDGCGDSGSDTAVGVGRKRARTTAGAKGKRSKPLLTIVYVWRRFEADALSEYLKGCGIQGVAVYHAGIDASTRARTQLLFDRGKVQCIVATVAFGMGVDKSDVRQVIHCTMPKSIESYMQVRIYVVMVS
jgi:superfamily II DNA/RNA helicase